jgi:hypothetical protein
MTAKEQKIYMITSVRKEAFLAGFMAGFNSYTRIRNATKEGIETDPEFKEAWDNFIGAEHENTR